MTSEGGLFVGDVGIDLTLAARRLPEPDEKLVVDAASEAPGGVVTNAAVACGRAEARVRVLIRVGADGAGRAVLEMLAAEDIAVSAQVSPGLTCRAVTILEPHGEKRLLLFPGVSMFPTAEQVTETSLDGVGWVHTAAYDRPVALLLIDRCRRHGIPWSLDIEPATFPGGIDELAAHICGGALVFCNSRAAAAIGGDAAARLLAMGAGSVVLTLGRDGAVLCTPTERTTVAPPPSEIVDTTGAGDCLAGWFVAERLAGSDPGTALRCGVAAATISCGRVGAHASFPTRSSIREALGRQAARRRLGNGGGDEHG